MRSVHPCRLELGDSRSTGTDRSYDCTEGTKVLLELLQTRWRRDNLWLKEHSLPTIACNPLDLLLHLVAWVVTWPKCSSCHQCVPPNNLDGSYYSLVVLVFKSSPFFSWSCHHRFDVIQFDSVVEANTILTALGNKMGLTDGGWYPDNLSPKMACSMRDIMEHVVSFPANSLLYYHKGCIHWVTLSRSSPR